MPRDLDPSRASAHVAGGGGRRPAREPWALLHRGRGPAPGARGSWPTRGIECRDGAPSGDGGRGISRRPIGCGIPAGGSWRACGQAGPGGRPAARGRGGCVEHGRERHHHPGRRERKPGGCQGGSAEARRAGCGLGRGDRRAGRVGFPWCRLRPGGPRGPRWLHPDRPAGAPLARRLARPRARRRDHLRGGWVRRRRYKALIRFGAILVSGWRLGGTGRDHHPWSGVAVDGWWRGVDRDHEPG